MYVCMYVCMHVYVYVYVCVFAHTIRVELECPNKWTRMGCSVRQFAALHVDVLQCI